MKINQNETLLFNDLSTQIVESLFNGEMIQELPESFINDEISYYFSNFMEDMETQKYNAYVPLSRAASNILEERVRIAGETGTSTLQKILTSQTITPIEKYNLMEKYRNEEQSVDKFGNVIDQQPLSFTEATEAEIAGEPRTPAPESVRTEKAFDRWMRTYRLRTGQATEQDLLINSEIEKAKKEQADKMAAALGVPELPPTAPKVEVAQPVYPKKRERIIDPKVLLGEERRNLQSQIAGLTTQITNYEKLMTRLQSQIASSIKYDEKMKKLSPLGVSENPPENLRALLRQPWDDADKRLKNLNEEIASLIKQNQYILDEKGLIAMEHPKEFPINPQKIKDLDDISTSLQEQLKLKIKEQSAIKAIQDFYKNLANGQATNTPKFKAELPIKLKQVLTSLEGIQNEVQKQKTRLQEIDAEIGYAEEGVPEKELSQMKEKSKALESSIAQLKEYTATYDSQIQALNQEVTKLKTDIFLPYSNKRADLQNKYDTLLRERSNYHPNIDVEYDELTKKLAPIGRALTTSIKEETVAKKEFTNRIRPLQERIKKLQPAAYSSNEKLKSQEEELAKITRVAEKERIRQTNKYMDWEESLDYTSETKDHLQGEASTLSRSLISTKEEKEALEKEKKELEARQLSQGQAEMGRIEEPVGRDEEGNEKPPNILEINPKVPDLERLQQIEEDLKLKDRFIKVSEARLKYLQDELRVVPHTPPPSEGEDEEATENLSPAEQTKAIVAMQEENKRKQAQVAEENAMVEPYNQEAKARLGSIKGPRDAQAAYQEKYEQSQAREKLRNPPKKKKGEDEEESVNLPPVDESGIPNADYQAELDNDVVTPPVDTDVEQQMRKYMKPDSSFFETTGKPMSTKGLLYRINKMVKK